MMSYHSTVNAKLQYWKVYLEKRSHNKYFLALTSKFLCRNQLLDESNCTDSQIDMIALLDVALHDFLNQLAGEKQVYENLHQIGNVTIVEHWFCESECSIIRHV